MKNIEKFRVDSIDNFKRPHHELTKKSESFWLLKRRRDKSKCCRMNMLNSELSTGDHTKESFNNASNDQSKTFKDFSNIQDLSKSVIDENIKASSDILKFSCNNVINDNHNKIDKTEEKKIKIRVFDPVKSLKEIKNLHESKAEKSQLNEKYDSQTQNLNQDEYEFTKRLKLKIYNVSTQETKLASEISSSVIRNHKPLSDHISENKSSNFNFSNTKTNLGNVNKNLKRAENKFFNYFSLNHCDFKNLINVAKLLYSQKNDYKSNYNILTHTPSVVSTENYFNNRNFTNHFLQRQIQWTPTKSSEISTIDSCCYQVNRNHNLMNENNQKFALLSNFLSDDNLKFYKAKFERSQTTNNHFDADKHLGQKENKILDPNKNYCYVDRFDSTLDCNDGLSQNFILSYKTSDNKFKFSSDCVKNFCNSCLNVNKISDFLSSDKSINMLFVENNKNPYSRNESSNLKLHPKIRSKIINYIINVCNKFEDTLSSSTLFSAISIFDRYIKFLSLESSKINKKDQLYQIYVIATACIYVSSKIHDLIPVSIVQLTKKNHFVFLIQEILVWERILCTKLNFLLTDYTVLDFVYKYLNELNDVIKSDYKRINHVNCSICSSCFMCKKKNISFQAHDPLRQRNINYIRSNILKDLFTEKNELYSVAIFLIELFATHPLATQFGTNEIAANAVFSSILICAEEFADELLSYLSQECLELVGFLFNQSKKNKSNGVPVLSVYAEMLAAERFRENQNMLTAFELYTKMKKKFTDSPGSKISKFLAQLYNLTDKSKLNQLLSEYLLSEKNLFNKSYNEEISTLVAQMITDKLPFDIKYLNLHVDQLTVAPLGEFSKNVVSKYKSIHSQFRKKFEKFLICNIK